MNSYAPATDVTVEFDLIGPNQDMLTVSAATYAVYDDEGTEVAAGPVTVGAGATQLSVTVLAADNTIAVGQINGARTVILSVVTPTGTIDLSQTYLIQSNRFLGVPALSGMTLPQSLMLAAQMASDVVDVWDDATDDERRAALLEAWTRIVAFPLRPWLEYEEPPSDIDRKVVEGDFRVSDLDEVTWLRLPATFRSALKRAQLIEACVILGGDPVWDRRNDGLISKTVGESSEMFAVRKPGVTSMAPKSLRELRPYIRRSIRIGRC